MSLLIILGGVVIHSEHIPSRYRQSECILSSRDTRRLTKLFHTVNIVWTYVFRWSRTEILQWRNSWGATWGRMSTGCGSGEDRHGHTCILWLLLRTPPASHGSFLSTAHIPLRTLQLLQSCHLFIELVMSRCHFN